MKFLIIILVFIDFICFETKIISTFKPRMIQTDNDPATVEYIFTINNKHHHIILTESEFNKHNTIVAVNDKLFNHITHPKGSFMEGRLANTNIKNIYLRFINGIHGILNIANTTLEILPIKKFRNRSELKYLRMTLQNKNDDHVAVINEKNEKNLLKCGVKINSGKKKTDNKMKYYDPHFSISSDKRNYTSILPLTVGIPYELFQETGFSNNDTQTVIDKVLYVVYSSNQLYQATNILILCSFIQIYTKPNNIPNLSTLSSKEQLSYIQTIMRPDIAERNKKIGFLVIFTKSFSDSVIGISYDNHICDNYSISAVLAIEPLRMILVLSHEIGHLFGLAHTEIFKDNPSCNCPFHCIMDEVIPSGNINDVSWNTCDYDKFLADVDSNPCIMHSLNFKPINKIYCGNNVLDQGEDCDCGLPSECANKKLDKICDPFSCKFYSGCNCLEGSCCKNCIIQPENSSCYVLNNECSVGICRKKADICDPIRIQPNGTRCNNNQDYCFNGTCLKHGSRCVDHFGKDASVGNPDCFQYFNSRTDKSGNCGFNTESKTFISCSTKDIYCGLLTCYSNSNSHFENETTIEVNSNHCTVKYTSLVNSEFSNILSVHDGIPCDINKTCWFNKCLTELEYIEIKECGTFSKLSNDNECLCINNYEKFNHTCIKKPLSNGIIATIVIFSIIGFIVVGTSVAWTIWKIIVRYNEYILMRTIRNLRFNRNN